MIISDNYQDLKKARVIVIDDEPDTREIISLGLRDQVAEVCCASTVKEALTIAESREFDVALIDLHLPDGSGYELINKLKNLQRKIVILIISGYANDETMFKLKEFGVHSILTKPFSLNQLKFSLSGELLRSTSNNSAPHNAGRIHERENCELTGESTYVKDLKQKISDFAAGDVPVLIQGPTGTGKEIIARAIHSSSRRCAKPMIAVNSSAIPEHLEESEFFGHAKGAFTGANERKEGILKCADGSTLFLDEVGDLSLRIQTKLLRALDGHEFMRIGDITPQRSDFRLISATNRPLDEMIRTGAFREDLYFRLKAFTIHTKPLSCHREDIPVLVEAFLQSVKKRDGREFSINGEALDMLMNHEWQGNIRELKNTVESLCVISIDTGIITKVNVTLMLTSDIKVESSSSVIPFASAKNEFEKQYYLNLLQKYEGNITLAARASGIERAYFSKRIKTLGLRKPPEYE